ncbi:unnamed protein product [Mucor hiemalis]
MGKWDLLPNEVLTCVFQKLTYRDLYQCMPVNQNWLTVTQMIMYKDISIDIGFTDEIYSNAMLNTLVNSPFSPGFWVRKFSVARIKVPDNVFSMDPKNDPLHLPITHCPLVEELCFERTNYVFEMEWIYLRKVLEQHAGWKLRNIARNYDAKDYLQYYTCALIMADSLRQFQLKSRIGNDKYEAHFKEFSKLDSLTISRRVAENIIQCDPIISSIPTLTEINATFYIPPTTQPKSTNPLLNLSDIGKQKYSNIKSMQLRDLPLSSDAELVYLISKFNQLDHLTIKFGKGKPWPLNKITIPVLREFFAFIDKIPEHTVTFKDIDIMTVLVEYYKYQSGSRKYILELFITNFLDKSGKSTSLEITNLNKEEEIIVLGYNLVGKEAKESIGKIKTAFYKIGSFLREAHITLTGKEPMVKDANTFLSIVFEYCQELEKVILSHGELTSAVINKKPIVAPINHFVFKKTLIDSFALTRLSFYLPYLEIFHLDNCAFSNFNYTKSSIRIVMEETRFGEFILSYTSTTIPGTMTVDKEFTDHVKRKKNLVFITIHFGKSRYFCGDPEYGELVHVSKKTYFEDLLKFQKLKNQFHTTTFLMSVKSMHCLTFITPQKTHRLLC